MSRPGPQRTPELEQEVLRRFQGGQPRKFIARDLRVRYYTVQGILSDLLPGYAHGNRSFTEAQEQEIIRSLTGGDTVADLARKYECHPGTLRHLLQRYGLGIEDRRRRVLTDAETATAISSLQAGDTKQAIARRLGVHVSLLTRIYTAHGLIGQRKPRFGPDSPNWKGGQRITEDGYRYVRVPPNSPYIAMAKADGYVPEHRLVMAEYLGRPLMDYETVHHIDGTKSNNAIANLQLRIGRHGKGQAYRCRDCGSHNIEVIPIAG